MSAAVLRLADIEGHTRPANDLGVFSPRIFPVPVEVPGRGEGEATPANARNRRAGAGWSALPMTRVEKSSAPEVPDEVPVYSIATEPAMPSGELRWVGHLLCLMTAFATSSALVAVLL